MTKKSKNLKARTAYLLLELLLFGPFLALKSLYLEAYLARHIVMFLSHQRNEANRPLRLERLVDDYHVIPPQG